MIRLIVDRDMIRIFLHGRPVEHLTSRHIHQVANRLEHLSGSPASARGTRATALRTASGRSGAALGAGGLARRPTGPGRHTAASCSPTGCTAATDWTATASAL